MEDDLVERTCDELDYYTTLMMRQEAYIDALLDHQVVSKAKPDRQDKFKMTDPHDSSLSSDEDERHDAPKHTHHQFDCVAWRVYPVYDQHRHVIGYECQDDGSSDLIGLDHLQKQRRDAEIKEAYKMTRAYRDKRMAVMALYHHRLQRATLYLVKHDTNDNQHYGKYRIMTKYLGRLNRCSFDDARLHRWTPKHASAYDA